MNENATNTQSVYNKLGVSTEKEDVERALEKTKIEELYSGSFCKILSDPQESDYALCLHEDGAGSKSIQAYIHWKETGDPSVFKGIAQDATVMNTDDMLCIGATNFVIADTIARNSKNISGDV
ncbi:MAG: phosphoribosylformylglycinamidine cyclo-ligase, partial [Candidatus Diapherotrites archaeon]|nr:phosphoribosylformylglycinamidine cyclo-ligase [Candidatus Diapherotrites archaeon]